MKIVVVGGVAAGTKAAAKIKRADRTADVHILTKSAQISYAGCGLPYYIGGSIPSEEALVVHTPEKFSALTGVRVTTECEVTKVLPASKQVCYRLANGEEGAEAYDKLILATGAYPLIPQGEGMDLAGVFCVRTVADAAQIREYLTKNGCRRAVVCGAGFIGLEIAENLKQQKMDVTVIEAADTVLPSAFDPEMADHIKKQLQKAGIRVMTGTRLSAVRGSEKAEQVVTDNGILSADLVILALGVRPATAFLADSGIAMERGAVIVDEHMRTNLPDIYAAGDCALVRNRLTGAPQWSAMGSTANLTGRLLALNVAGEDRAYSGCLGTGVARVLSGLNCGRTGLTEAAARACGLDVVSALCAVDDKPHYIDGFSSFIIKLVAERESGRLLGLQVIGAGNVDKIVDIAATGLMFGAAAADFETADFAYAPPFSTAISPFVTACHVLENKRAGVMNSFTPAEYAQGAAKGYTVIDAQPLPAITGARWVDLTHVAESVQDIPKDEKLLIVCARGRRAYLMQNILKSLGYTETRMLEGGTLMSTVRVERKTSALPAAEIKRVKGLGCLQDKRFGDVFNVRVITRNGKITAAENRAIAEAAEKFGSGEVTMTTRLTLEIQGVPYDNLDALFAFLADHGLETGGTGSKVRPVVSCKGTTCQYGLIDTFALSEKLHDIFYKGWHDVTLPHKFKIAVGGCPNNCVKPDLNDLGIIGQRVPAINLSLCRGCKVCQIEKACPIHTAAVVNGKLVINPADCNHCGRCVGKCPFGAVTESSVGYKVYIGGRWGKRVAQGTPLNRLFTSEEEVVEIVELAIMLFRSEGVTGERFSDTIARLGFDYVEDKLLNGEFKKDEILEKKVTGGATC